MKHNREFRNRLIRIWTTDFWQRQSRGERIGFSTSVVETTGYSYAKKNPTFNNISYTIYKNQLEKYHISKCKA